MPQAETPPHAARASASCLRALSCRRGRARVAAPERTVEPAQPHRRNVVRTRSRRCACLANGLDSWHFNQKRHMRQPPRFPRALFDARPPCTPRRAGGYGSLAAALVDAANSGHHAILTTDLPVAPEELPPDVSPWRIVPEKPLGAAKRPSALSSPRDRAFSPTRKKGVTCPTGHKRGTACLRAASRPPPPQLPRPA